MRLTKRKALHLCLELWEWLEENPSASKWAWPRWNTNAGDVSNMLSDCPCCEYSKVPMTKDGRTRTCTKCPLLGYWTTEDKAAVKNGGNPCCRIGSPYDEWGVLYSAEQNQKAAQGMVKITKLAISKLPKLKGELS